MSAPKVELVEELLRALAEAEGAMAYAASGKGTSSSARQKLQAAMAEVRVVLECAQLAGLKVPPWGGLSR
jgi:hypothetical protein